MQKKYPVRCYLCEARYPVSAATPRAIQAPEYDDEYNIISLVCNINICKMCLQTYADLIVSRREQAKEVTHG